MRQKPVAPELYTKEYFETACEGYDEFLSTEGQQLSRRLKAAFALASVETGMRVLDVGCGRGEILLHCARLGAEVLGIDYAPAALEITQNLLSQATPDELHRIGVAQADAKHLPFPDSYFDRVLMFDVVEHLHPWELHQAMLEVRRVLKPNGSFIIHTAPNIWYDRYAYPIVRFVRRMMGQGAKYPKNPRAFLVDHNQDVHVNEQSWWSLQQALDKAGFKGKVWLDSPPQHRQEVVVLAALRWVLFRVPPMRWFFEREVFAVAQAKGN
ncbi:MAG: methyltransferase domain-containing protein [Anaerolineales bacterium]|nr:methyltransferase domain-containing protein [Anaerolineales bacterium]